MDAVTTSSDLNLYGMIACQESPIRVEGEITELLDHRHQVDHCASNNVVGKDNGFNLLPEVDEVSMYCDSSDNRASNSLEVSACEKVHVLAPFPPPRSHNFYLTTKENNDNSRCSSFPKKRQRIGSVDKKNYNNNGRTTVYGAMESFIENIFNCAGGGCSDIVGTDTDTTNTDNRPFASVPMQYKSNTNKKSSSSNYNNSSSNDKENDSTSLNETGSTYQGSFLNDESYSSWRIIGSTSPTNSQSSLTPSPQQRRKEGDYEYAEQKNQQQNKLEPPLQPPDIRRLSTNGQVTTKINGSSLPLPRSKSLDFLFSSSSPYPHINHHYYEEKHLYPTLPQQQCQDNHFRVVGMIEEPRDEFRWMQQNHHNRHPNAGINSRSSIKGMVEISQPHHYVPSIQQTETSGLNETYMTL